MHGPVDLLLRPLSVDDYVVLFNNIYQVRELLGHVYNGNGLVRIVLVEIGRASRRERV